LFKEFLNVANEEKFTILSKFHKYIHTCIQIYTAPKIVKTNLRRSQLSPEFVATSPPVEVWLFS